MTSACRLQLYNRLEREHYSVYALRRSLGARCQHFDLRRLFGCYHPFVQVQVGQNVSFQIVDDDVAQIPACEQYFGQRYWVNRQLQCNLTINILSAKTLDFKCCGYWLSSICLKLHYYANIRHEHLLHASVRPAWRPENCNLDLAMVGLNISMFRKNIVSIVTPISCNNINMIC
jgi:hypothetical protein